MNNLSKYINKRNLVILFAFLVLGFALYWFSTHSYLEVNVQNKQAGQVAEVIIDNKVLKTSEASVRELVKKGQHNVYVKQGDNSYFTSVNSPGFLQTNKVQANLVAEDTRTFIGNSVLPCGAYGLGGMYSWQCDGFLKSAVLHKPPTDTSLGVPSKVTDVDDPYYIESFISMGNTDYFIVRASDMDGSVHAALPIGFGGKVDFSKNTILESLDSNKIYSSTPYRDGVLFFSTSDKELIYYDKMQNKGTILTSPEVDTGDLALQSVNTSGDSILLSYTNSASPEYRGELSSKGAGVYDNTVGEEGFKTSANPIGHTSIVLINNDRVESFSYEFNSSQARLCGDYLCLLHGDQLDIMDLKKNRVSKSIYGVRQINVQGEVIYITDASGVLIYDSNKNEGYYAYSLGGYDFCGMRVVSAKQFVVCIQNNRSKQVVLVNLGQKTNDNIDKKVLELAKIPEVRTVSAFGNFIHISPELGELVFNDALGELEYDPKKKLEANAKINEKVSELKIDTSRYKIINILSP